MKKVQIQLTPDRPKLLTDLGYTFKKINFVLLEVDVPIDMSANALVKKLKTYKADKCLFDQWFDGDNRDVDRFTKQLFELFIIADGVNKDKIISTYPELFENIQSIKPIL